MEAYTTVISLLRTLDQRNIPELFHDHTAETVDSIRATAEYFQEFLDNACNKSGVDPEKIKSLEEKIRVAASYAEDVLERKISQIIKGVSWTFGILQHQDLLPVVEKMDATKKQVMDIVSHDADQILKLSGDSGIDTPSTSYPMLSDQLEDDIVHGLDDDLEIITNRLLKGQSSNLEIVTISGMGGIGKTTLARKAYDHLQIRYHFDILAWVTISQEFRGRNVMLEAMRCISKKRNNVNENDYDKMDESELADLVQKNLKGRRYLVVVDDIWSGDVWDSIRGIFPDCNNRSRILLTTREPKVAMCANTSSPHEMNPLNLESGWKLLCDKVFGSKHDHRPELEEIGKEIVEKCQGLPLTISVIAGHLSKTARTLESWKDVARTLSKIIASHPDKCLGVLGLSYHYLPNHLKPCFLYMSCFPEDFQVEPWRLIQLWMAEGFIRMSGSCKSLEEVAIDYLEDLIGRNLIQARKRRFNGEIKACGIHDLLREFCLIEAEMTNHMHVVRAYPTLLEQKHNVRRLRFQTKYFYVDHGYKLFPPASRSIYLFSSWNLTYSPQPPGILPIYRGNPILHEFFSHFNLLRVLAIFDTFYWFDSFPLVLTTLFHLRYLQIQFFGNIPESISELQNLQTLICGDLYVTLPEKIWMMKNLRHIRVGRGTYLPNPRSKCILNKHLVTGLPNLEEFFNLTHASCSNEVFSLIPNLKRLIIRETLGEENIFPYGLIDMSSLRKLEAFKFYGMKLEEHRFAFATSLRRLSLTWCNFHVWEDISSTVIRLPNLEELKLKGCRTRRPGWSLRANDKVKSLKLLLLSNLYLYFWEASSDNFPKLKRLVLKNCKRLKEIPSDFGEIGTLESIELHDCSTTAEDSARNIEQEHEDLGNNSLKVYIHNSRRN